MITKSVSAQFFSIKQFDALKKRIGLPRGMKKEVVSQQSLQNSLRARRIREAQLKREEKDYLEFQRKEIEQQRLEQQEKRLRDENSNQQLLQARLKIFQQEQPVRKVNAQLLVEEMLRVRKQQIEVKKAIREQAKQRQRQSYSQSLQAEWMHQQKERERVQEKRKRQLNNAAFVKKQIKERTRRCVSQFIESNIQAIVREKQAQEFQFDMMLRQQSKAASAKQYFVELQKLQLQRKESQANQQRASLEEQLKAEADKANSQQFKERIRQIQLERTKQYEARLQRNTAKLANLKQTVKSAQEAMLQKQLSQFKINQIKLEEQHRRERQLKKDKFQFLYQRRKEKRDRLQQEKKQSLDLAIKGYEESKRLEEAEAAARKESQLALQKEQMAQAELRRVSLRQRQQRQLQEDLQTLRATQAKKKSYRDYALGMLSGQRKLDLEALIK